MCVKLWLGGCDVLGSCRSPALLWGFGIVSVSGWLVGMSYRALVGLSGSWADGLKEEQS